MGMGIHIPIHIHTCEFRFSHENTDSHVGIVEWDLYWRKGNSNSRSGTQILEREFEFPSENSQVRNSVPGSEVNGNSRSLSTFKGTVLYTLSAST